jgi:hypothetical protein
MERESSLGDISSATYGHPIFSRSSASTFSHSEADLAILEAAIAHINIHILQKKR